MMKLKSLSIFAGLLMVGSMYAQPGGGNLGQIELSVTEKYKAEVGEAVKLTETPDFKDTTTSKLKVNYRITSQPINVRFSPEPIDPARIRKVPVNDLYNGMARLGFGLYTTPLAEVYWNSDRSSSRGFGFWGRHFSTQDGAPTIFENNAMSQNDLGAYFNKYYRKMKWETQILGSWNKYSYYGIDELPSADSVDLSDFEDNPPSDPPSTWFRLYELNTSLTGEKEKNLGYLDEIGLVTYNFTDSRGGKENRVRINSFWELPAGENDLNIDLNMSWFNLGFDSTQAFPESPFSTTLFDTVYPTEQSHFTIQARPKVNLALNKLIFDFGLNIYADNFKSDLTQGEFKVYFFPEVQFEYPFVRDVLSVFGGVKGQLRQNSYRNMVDANPYITPAFASRPTRTTDLFFGIEGILSSTTSFNIRGGFLLQRDLVLYYRNPMYRSNYFIDSIMSFPGLDVIYDNSETFYTRGELAVNFNNNLQGALYGELRSYSMDMEQEAWHLPSFLAGFNVEYTIREKLKLGTDWNYVGKREAFIQDDNPQINSTLPAYIDAGLNVEYLYNSRLSGFLVVSNLLNQKYDMYLGYKAQKINFLIGFAYKF